MKHRSLKALFLLCLILLGWQTLAAQSIRTKVNKGNAQFKKGRYEEALANYKDALLDDPLNETALFNQGDALYKLKKYDQAVETFQKDVGSENLALSAKAFYNIGNAYFQQNKLKESIQAYKKSLELNPSDRDAKYNLELARAKLKEMSKKKKQQPQNRQNKQKQGQGGQEKQSKQNQKKNKQKQKNQNQQKQQQKKQQKKKQAQKQKADKNKMSKKEAQRILNALRENEQNSKRKQAPIRANGRVVEKDW